MTSGPRPACIPPFLDGSVGESQGEFSVGSEFDDPAVVVDLGVMPGADRYQVGHIGAAPETPPDDVVQLAAVVADTATRDRTAAIQPA